jgi:hypothetical protein
VFLGFFGGEEKILEAGDVGIEVSVAFHKYIDP